MGLSSAGPSSSQDPTSKVTGSLGTREKMLMPPPFQSYTPDLGFAPHKRAAGVGASAPKKSEESQEPTAKWGARLEGGLEAPASDSAGGSSSPRPASREGRAGTQTQVPEAGA